MQYSSTSTRYHYKSKYSNGFLLLSLIYYLRCVHQDVDDATVRPTARAIKRVLVLNNFLGIQITLHCTNDVLYTIISKRTPDRVNPISHISVVNYHQEFRTRDNTGSSDLEVVGENGAACRYVVFKLNTYRYSLRVLRRTVPSRRIILNIYFFDGSLIVISLPQHEYKYACRLRVS